MRWPWKRHNAGDRCVVSWCGQALSFVTARCQADGVWQLQLAGVEHQGADSREAFAKRIRGLNLNAMQVQVMLRPEQYQVLKVDAPAVPPEELRAAARYQIREMLQTHIDDVTLDVMRVGAGDLKGAGHLFVVVTANAVVREIDALAVSLGWTVPVIDIQETAQRNLQFTQTTQVAHADSAQAALVLVDGQQAVLTISARDELYYTRRLDIPAGFLKESFGFPVQANDVQAFSPVAEYVPDYSVNGVSYGSDYSDSRQTATSGGGVSEGGDESAQRFLVEVQRSLDVWDRSWSSLPLTGIHLYAGSYTAELAKWLTSQLGLRVEAFETDPQFAGFEQLSEAVQAQCFPLLGVLQRVEARQP